MRKRILAVVAVLLLLSFAAYKAAEEKECWLRTEDGLLYPPDYLHTLAEKDSKKAKTYTGTAICFVAPFEQTYEQIRLQYYGYLGSLLKLTVPGGAEFWVEYEGEQSPDYQRGELLKVSGKITALSPRSILILNVAGTPGWPNKICIERIN